MPLVARLLLTWFTISMVIGPFIGMMLAGGSRPPTPVPAGPPAQTSRA
jgi:hypothetical protein